MIRFLPLLILFGFLLELATLIAVGQRIGVLATLLLVIGGGVAGVAAIRAAGLGMANAMRQPVLDRKFATQDAAARFLLLPAGLLLILPGFISDLIGLVLLLPSVRRLLAGKFVASVDIREGWRDGRQPGTRDRGDIIEGEAVEIETELRRFPPRRDDTER